MIDIHTHIIPALDDGPPDMETSIGIGQMAAQDGITGIISTSHSEEAFALGRGEMLALLDAVRSAWAEAGISMRLELGVEIYLRPEIVADLKSGHAWGLAGSQYVLVELPYQPWPVYTDRILFDLQLAGYVPILAHPERYVAIQEDPNRMCALSERGVLGQVTANALHGGQGSRAKSCAETLVRHKMVQFISSDTHGIVPRERLPRLSEAVKAATELVGAQIAEAMVTENPARILSHTHLNPEPERVTPRKWSLGSLFKGSR